MNVHYIEQPIAGQGIPHGKNISDRQRSGILMSRTFKSFFISCILLFSLANSVAQVITIPAGNPTGSNFRQPLANFYGYEATDAIYLASQIGTTGTINSIGFYLNSRTASALVNVPVTIKMQMTTATALATAARNFQTFSASATTVYSGTITDAMLSANNWVTLPLTTAFNYTGNNLEIFINTTIGGSGSGEGSTDKQFRWSTVTGSSRCITWERDTNAALTNNNATNQTALPNVQLTFGAAVTCFPPTAPTSSSITQTGATISWTAASPAPSGGYQYEVRTSGVAGGGSLGLVTSGSTAAGVVSKTLTGLSANTSYSYYVRSSCGGTDYSAWTSAATFSTLCNAVNVPYTQDFESATVPAVPSCTSLQNIGSGNNWITSSAPGSGFTSKTLQYSFNSTNAANALFYTQGINLTAGTSYTLSYRYGNNNTSFTEKLRVGYGTSPLAASQTVLATHATISSGAPTTNSLTVTPATSGIYYFGFNVYSAANQYNLFVDDISVVATPAVISSFTPSTVCSGGTNSERTIVITGDRFTGATSVKFNGLNAQSFNVDSNTQITATVASTSTTGAISISGPNGSVTSGTALTVRTSPSVANISGPTSVCLPNSITLSDATPTGVWNSSNIDVATVNSSGVVTSVGTGTATISYSVTDTGCTTTKTYLVTVNRPVQITSSTATQTTTVGGSTFFMVSATGTGNPSLGYQWQITADGENFTDITDNSIYSGSNTATLILNNVPQSLNESLYHCVVTGICGAVATDLAVLIVGETGIDVQPMPQTICASANASATFSVVASSDVTAYQWQEDLGGDDWMDITDGGVYSGANTATLTLSGITLAYSGNRYRVNVIGVGSAQSNPAVLNVIQPPAITSSPVNQTVCYTGGSANFSVAASGGVSSYQWQYSANGGTSWANITNNTPAGATYNGASTTTLAVSTTSATPANGLYSYRAVVSGAGSCPGATSATAQLIVNTPVITAQPSAATATNGSTAIFTVASSAASPTYQWQYATAVGGPYTNVANGTPVGITYTGTNTATLSVVISASAVSGTGQYYRAVVSSPVSCSLPSNGAQLSILSYCTPAMTTVSASGDYINNFTFANITNNGSGDTATDYTYYSALTANVFGGTSYNVSLTAGGTSSTFAQQFRIWIDYNHDGDFADAGESVFATSAATFSPTASTGTISIPAVSATVLSGVTRMRVASRYSTVVGATAYCTGESPYGEYEDYNINIAVPPACSGTPVAGTIAASVNPICLSGTSVLTLSGYSAGVTGINFQWYNSAGAINGATAATFTTPVLTASESYYVRVTCATSGAFSNSNTITIVVNSPAVTSTAPATRCGFGTVVLGATSSAGTTLNWYASATGGTSLATGPNYTTPVISTTTTYYVDATISTCTSSRTAVTATVSAPPALTLTSSSASICSGAAGATVTVTSGLESYNTFVWSPSIGITGSAASGYTFNPSATTSYTLTASQSSGSLCQTSTAFVVTVNQTPLTPVITPGNTTICAGNILALTTAASGAASGTVTLGTGTTATAATSFPNPLSAYYGGVKHQILFTAAELSAQGLKAGSSINGLTFYLNASSANACADFTIRMGNTSLTALTGFVAGTTTVYGPLTYTPSGTGLVSFTLATPYIWNGTSNLIVETVHNAGNSGNGSGTRTRITATAANTVYYGASDSVAGGIAGFDSLTSYTVSGASTSRPNMTFAFTNALPTWAPFTGLYSDAAATIAYNGQVAATVYAKPATSTSYTATVTSAQGCSKSSAPVAITVNQFYNFYADSDGDSYGAGNAISLCAANANTPPAGYVTNNTDCNDSNALVYQNATYYVDADGDGRDNGTASVCSGASVPSGYATSTLGLDCNDNNANVYQNATYFIDSDGDGYTNGSGLVCSGASAPSGYSSVSLGTDCDDTNDAIFQGETLYVDNDGDGYDNGIQTVCYGAVVPNGYSLTTSGTDCNDNNAAAYQSATLYVDNDADGYNNGTQTVCYGASVPTGYSATTLSADCNDTNASLHATFSFYADADGDTYGTGALLANVCAVNATTPPAGYSVNNTDCNDNNAATYQSATLYVDNDSDGYDNGSQTVCYGASVPTGYSATTLGTDCNDNNAAVYESATLYVDNDADGYDNGSQVVCYGASVPAGYSSTTSGTDCNDANASLHATFSFYTDADGDHYGTDALLSNICAVNAATPPAGYAVNNTDCNDNIAAINPGHAEVLYNGVDDNCDGQLDEGNQLKTKLLPEVCGATLASINSIIGITTLNVNTITMYRIKVVNGASTQIIERNVPHFTLQELAAYDYATTYTISVELQKNGVWLGYYGDTCLVSSPAVLASGGAAQVSPSQCGITLARMNTLVATTSLAGVTGYRFRVTNVTNATGPNVVQTIDRNLNWFSLTMLAQYNYGTTYTVEISVRTNGVYSGFGSPCQVSSPASPTLVNCGGTVATPATLVSCSSLSDITQYRFQITRLSDNSVTTIDRPNNYFTFNMVPGYTQGGQYGVRVAVMTVGTWSPFGDACQITAPGGTARFTAETSAPVSDGFRAAAYPNPFANAFTVDVTASGSENVQLRVYDMTGRLIESRDAKVSELNTQQVGERYPSGVYNVIVTQGENVRTLRVIKR